MLATSRDLRHSRGKKLDVSMILYQLHEDDVREILQSELVMIGTDGLFGGHPHPRVYRTYPRILGRYVREENFLSMEEAVRKMSAPSPSNGFGSQRSHPRGEGCQPRDI